MLDRQPSLTIGFEMDAATEFAVFAEELAQAARSETLHRSFNTCTVTDKGSGSYDPVTDADREAERVMRQIIGEHYPDHGVKGEEWPDEPGCGAYRWSLDPIDGTRSFICGLPTWTTLIGLLKENRPVLGLVDAPCLDETYVGTEGFAYLRRRDRREPIRTSACRNIAEARLSTTDPFLFDEPASKAFGALRSKVRTVRYGHDGYAYARLAAGGLDLIVESGLKPHDYEALIALVLAAGGAIGDWRGGQDYEGGRIIAASTSELFDEAVGYFEELE